jgi:hypothetical protein
MSDKQQVGRIALRVEGDWWVAYFAKPKTMEGAIELARVRMTVVRPDAKRKAAFMELVRSYIDEILAEQTGVTPSWPEPVLAPEHEKAGRA